MKSTTYVQCTLKRTAASTTSTITSYLPIAFAKHKRVVRLRDDQGVWTDGWIVEQVGDTLVEENQLPDYRKAIRAHRQKTGDSLRRSKN